MIQKKLIIFLVLSLGLTIGWITNQAMVGAAEESPQLFPSAICGRVGEVVIVEGKNFTPNVLVNITWAGIALGTDPSPVQVDPAGNIFFQFIVPNDYDGPHGVRVSDGQLGAEYIFQLGMDCAPPATATPVELTPTFTVTPTPLPPTAVPELPRLSCTPDGVLPDTIIEVMGENFHPGVPFYQLRWDGVVIPWSPTGLTVSDNGKFTLSVVAPSDTYEMHTLVADDGRGGMATCYVNMVPRNPTPTATATPTLTPTPTPTWTPGPPPGITVEPTPILREGDYCAAIDAAFTRYPLANSQIDAGITVTNLNSAWSAGQFEVRIWQYYNLFEWDTGVSQVLPAMVQGEMVPAHLAFSSPQSGPTWFQIRLYDIATGQELLCPSAWFPLQIIQAEPRPPALLNPPDNVWLNKRELTLDWLPAEVPDRAGPVQEYEVQLVDLASGELVYQSTYADMTDFTYSLSSDYGARQLAWRARAFNPAGWSLWSSAFYFGIDTVIPEIELSLTGDQGTNGWWRSPVTVRVGGSDPAPGSGLQATYLQLGENRWTQVIPGGANSVEVEGVFDLHAYGRDGANNRSRVLAQPIKIDRQPPDYIEPHFSAEPTSGGWYTVPITISLEADDLISGVATQAIRIDGGSWQTDVLTMTTTGMHTIEFMATDMAGNTSPVRSTTAKLDLTPPAGTIALNGSLCQTCDQATASIAVGDAESGLGYWSLTLSLPPTGGLTAQGKTIIASGNIPKKTVALDGSTLPVGPLTLTLTIQDAAGWITTEELSMVNAPHSAGPTPTPWIIATATPWPAPTSGATPTSVPFNRSPTDGSDDDGNNGNGGNGGASGSSGSGSAGSSALGVTGYPVGGTVVPAILPVTGEEYAAIQVVLISSGVMALLLGCGWVLTALTYKNDPQETEKQK
ncbi:MAG: hypothetical protein BroJett011_08010 [Chloroflexota bacterium]|nr:MAG: hypothetical protein BroJett011_08010 [Chloroflexota bacterium]